MFQFGLMALLVALLWFWIWITSPKLRTKVWSFIRRRIVDPIRYREVRQAHPKPAWHPTRK